MDEIQNLRKTQDMVERLLALRPEENLVSSSVGWHILQKKERFRLWPGLLGVFFFLAAGDDGLILWIPLLLYALISWLRSQKALRIHRYITAMIPDSLMTVKDLALAAGVQENTVVKDLKWAIAQRILPEGFLVEEEKLFLLNRFTFTLYRDLVKEQPLLEAEPTFSETEESPCAQILRHLEVLEGDLEGQDASALRRLITLAQGIEKAKAKANPATYIHFEDHYLPMVEKLALGARDLAWQNTSSSKESLNEIRRGMEIVEEAFRRMMEDIHSEMGSDTKRDLAALEMMMQRDRLMKEGPFGKGGEDA